MGTTTAMSARSLQYYVIANRWALDLEFFKVETAFFYRLIEEYFIRSGDATYAAKFKKITEDLSKLETDKSYAGRLLNNQLKQLELMAEDIIPEDIDSLADKQIEIEYLVTGLLNEYREVKKELFSIVETIRKARDN